MEGGIGIVRGNSAGGGRYLMKPDSAKVLRGRCSVCLRRFRLRKDGTLHGHIPRVPGKWGTVGIYACGGAWRAPMVEEALQPSQLAPYGHDDRGNPNTGAGAQSDID